MGFNAIFRKRPFLLLPSGEKLDVSDSFQFSNMEEIVSGVKHVDKLLTIQNDTKHIYFLNKKTGKTQHSIQTESLTGLLNDQFGFILSKQLFLYKVKYFHKGNRVSTYTIKTKLLHILNEIQTRFPNFKDIEISLTGRNRVYETYDIKK
ncbi:hypothetical protein K7I13_02890 [Brucepastera parasyntrophica]|uniref:hypothetical protein n=1 Tax=Brucepastera parasyntrophica TaxID=2880008 RepID=UPI00210BBAEB|nr:hypothetical protein [Brucepastera parasyntrophica]ULQ60275.1 hypothetical protein K7I13_02890 [Brucepastera parasyntrophica]